MALDGRYLIFCHARIYIRALDTSAGCSNVDLNAGFAVIAGSKIDSTRMRLIETNVPSTTLSGLPSSFRICMGYIGDERCLLPGSTGPGAFPTPGRHEARAGMPGHSRSYGDHEVSSSPKFNTAITARRATRNTQLSSMPSRVMGK